MFRICLHIDDIAILYRIQEYLGVGHVYAYKTSCVFVIRSTSDLIKVLIPFLDLNTLRTTKYLDYLDFKAILNFITNDNRKSTAVTETDLATVNRYIKNMNSGRTDFD